MKLPVIISNKNAFLSKMKNRKVKQVLSGGWYWWERGRYKEKVYKGECSGNVMY
jgi:hypothetical protein